MIVSKQEVSLKTTGATLRFEKSCSWLEVFRGIIYWQLKTDKVIADSNQ